MLVAVAVFLLLGHICALPGVAEAELAHASPHHAPADGHGEAAHVASCDATLPTTATACPRADHGSTAVAAMVAGPRAAVPAREGASGIVLPRTRASDRSRVLLHASFLL